MSQDDPQIVNPRFVGLPPGVQVRVPPHVQLARAGFPAQVVEWLRKCQETGWVLFATRLNNAPEDGKPLPGFEVRMFSSPNWPYDLLLRNMHHCRKIVNDIELEEGPDLAADDPNEPLASQPEAPLS